MGENGARIAASSRRGNRRECSGRDPGIPEWSKKEETLIQKEQRKWAEPTNKNL
jgi:hypothetical protein